MENNNEIINDVNSGRFFDSIGEGPKKLIIGGLGFAGGIITTKLIIPGVKKLGETLRLRKEHKELEDEILDEKDIIIKED